MTDETTTLTTALQTLRDAGDVALFAPGQMAYRQATAQAVITLAAKIRRWEAVDYAVDTMIADQVAFCAEWDRTVTGNRHNINPSPEISGLQFLSAEHAETQTGITPVQVSRWKKSLGLRRTDDPEQRSVKRAQYRAKVILKAFRAVGLEPDENHRAEGTGENEWFTPLQYIAAARSVMGSIDLDPATHPKAQERIQATEFFTKQDDGLARDWHGRVWLNPPYAQPAIQQFVEKLVAEFAAGRVSEAVLLTHNYTDTRWFQLAALACHMICFTRGRIKFTDVDGEDCAPTQGQAFCYFGVNERDFAATFAQYGFVVRHA